MITTAAVAKESKRCPIIQAGQNNCIGEECMMWEFYVPLAISPVEKPHGISDRYKLGYCGRSIRREG